MIYVIMSLSLCVGVVIGTILTRVRYDTQDVGSIVIVDDSADNAPSVFLEINRGHIDTLKTAKRISLQIVNRKP